MITKRDLIYRQIGAKIRYYRILKGMTQAELAQQIHVNLHMLNEIECGKYDKNLLVTTLLDIADGLRVDVSAFIYFTEQEKWIACEILKNDNCEK
ncbi:helix-turn-helix transcriptional regulator [Megasphaera paucivorans]|uniref:DNA-binding transcriptional regulator, XRE-family HTH domain n=1 Tax=Megasphaera paucivorans TaxID=349095 RepID=A0A1H0BBD4_9FIRM|nr:helix-turn-helix transcriptional regulator [Megasphaera paucivorans]SDN42926.1 DNA-binding transcriptional regulator, XRE-family HTH domain [Megasphaera paucivorans]